jgi:hypothetical protein
VKEHFQKKLFDPNKKSVERFVGEPKPLNKWITPDKVKAAAKTSNNNKAAGEDGAAFKLNYSSMHQTIYLKRSLIIWTML